MLEELYGNEREDFAAFVCKECGEDFDGKQDCIVHMSIYNHHNFVDHKGNNYDPAEDQDQGE